MDIKQFYTGPIQVNTYLCADEESKEAFIVDPEDICKPMDNYIESNGYKIKYIILTHGHGDHICGVPYYKEKFGCPIVANEKDNVFFNDPRANQSLAMCGRMVKFTPDICVDDGDTLQVGNMTLHILFTPGHSPGGISIYVGNVLFSGDTLFAESVGRTDFPGGSFAELRKSVYGKFYPLPDNTFVLPGHMGHTTIGHEKIHNPFL